MSALAVVGCVSNTRGLHSVETAKECYAAHSAELEAAARSMSDDLNIWIVLRGNNSKFTDRCFTLIDGFSVFSTEPLSETEVKTVKENIIPAFADERLESVRRMQTGFAEYAAFYYRNSLFDNIYLLCREINRTEDGELIELSYITDQADLGDGWFCVRYSS